MNRVFGLLLIFVLLIPSANLSADFQLPVDPANNVAEGTGPVTPYPNWKMEGNSTTATFGTSVSDAGDVNGDGYHDLVVGAPLSGYTLFSEGSAYLYYGSRNGLNTSAGWVAEGKHADARFGFSVDSAGDVNGDGYGDVIIGAPYFDNGERDEGRVYLYYGSKDGLQTLPAWMAEGTQAWAEFGYSVSGAGDFNGDGYSDVMVGAPNFDLDEYNGDTGRVFIYFGSPNGLSSSADWILDGGQRNGRFGFHVDTAGDVNGDTYSDILIGAPYQGCDALNSKGCVYAYYGSAELSGQSPDWIAEGQEPGSTLFGFSVSGAGDVNGDGYGDVMVGAPYYRNGQTGEGSVAVYYGALSGLAGSPSWIAESNQESAGFGYSLSSAGDFNEDGYGDIVIGAPTTDKDYEQNIGRVFVYFGSSSGLSTLPDWSAEGSQAYAWFGYSVGFLISQFNNVIIGQPFFTNEHNKEGAVYLYHREWLLNKYFLPLMSAP